jgi:hypothetical protein
MITVKVINPLWERRSAYAFPIQEFNYYTGEEVQGPRWVGPDRICLSTGDKNFPFRVIDRDRIVGSGYVKKEIPKAKTVSVPGSKPGTSYLVTIDNHGAACTCVGFGFRKDCKHVRAALAA